MSRPSKYRKRYCEQVITIGRTGASRTQIARSLGVARSTLYAWAKLHPVFADAFERATEAAQVWWENVALAAIDLPAHSFNTSLWIRVMTTRFPKDYRETKHKELTGKDGAPLPALAGNIEHLIRDVIERMEQE
jgi:hypothetical protein